MRSMPGKISPTTGIKRADSSRADLTLGETVQGTAMQVTLSVIVISGRRGEKRTPCIARAPSQAHWQRSRCLAEGRVLSLQYTDTMASSLAYRHHRNGALLMSGDAIQALD